MISAMDWMQQNRFRFGASVTATRENLLEHVETIMKEESINA